MSIVIDVIFNCSLLTLDEADDLKALLARFRSGTKLASSQKKKEKKMSEVKRRARSIPSRGPP